MKRRLAVAAATIVVAALAAGCGGGDDPEDGTATGTTGTTTTTTAASDTPTSGPLTKSEFIARADKICTSTVDGLRSAGANLRASIAKTKKVPPQEQLVTFVVDTSLPAYDRMLDQLRDLDPPKRDEKAIDAYLDSLAGAIDTVKAAPNEYVKQTAGDPFTKANARAKKYGLKACGA